MEMLSYNGRQPGHSLEGSATERNNQDALIHPQNRLRLFTPSHNTRDKGHKLTRLVTDCKDGKEYTSVRRTAKL